MSLSRLLKYGAPRAVGHPGTIRFSSGSKEWPSADSVETYLEDWQGHRVLLVSGTVYTR
ncbi:hypothetical protein J6590_004301 [Homalodisca vitripennis]|nr:hypothetical protein J6590_004301 [Homalodisca vitripennis]